jgi:hypothetical protein
LASVAEIVKVVEIEFEGVPVTAPVVVFKLRPAGKLPLVSA